MHKLSGVWTHQGIQFASVRSEQYALVCVVLLTIYALHWRSFYLSIAGEELTWKRHIKGTAQCNA